MWIGSPMAPMKSLAQKRKKSRIKTSSPSLSPTPIRKCCSKQRSDQGPSSQRVATPSPPPSALPSSQVRMETRMAWCLVILFISLINVDARRKVESVSVNEETLGKAAKISSTMKLLEEIGMVSSEVCHILPADLEAKCLETSRTYLHQTKLLFQGPSHEESHCNNTELCTDEDRSLIGIDIFIEEKILMKLLDERGCVACRRFVKELMTKLKQSKARTKMMEVLIEYCEEVEENEQLCKETVYKYAPQVLSKLEKTKPSDLCRRMSMCVEEINM